MKDLSAFNNFTTLLPSDSTISLIVIGMIPIIFLSTTCYLKVSIVFAVLRSALGGGQIPSQAISGILSLLVSLYTISPVLSQMINNFNTDKKVSVVEKLDTISSPLLNFVRNNVQPKERLFFYSLEQKRSPTPGKNPNCITENIIETEKCLTENESYSSLILSFVSGELRIACLIGVYIFIPFLVIDLVVSTLLTGLGMMMVSPVTITLPLKLLVFILSDGWRSLIEHLIIGYKLTIP